MTKTPTPDGAEMGERLRLVRSATIPPARDLQVARTERSPGLGQAARLPGCVLPVALSRYDMPFTVAGPRRTRTGFRESPFACNDEASLSRATLQRNYEAGTEGQRRDHDDHGDQRPRSEASNGEREGERGARRERRGSVAREAAAGDFLHGEGVEARGRHDRCRVRAQQG